MSCSQGGGNLENCVVALSRLQSSTLSEPQLEAEKYRVGDPADRRCTRAHILDVAEHAQLAHCRFRLGHAECILLSSEFEPDEEVLHFTLDLLHCSAYTQNQVS